MERQYQGKALALDASNRGSISGTYKVYGVSPQMNREHRGRSMPCTPLPVIPRQSKTLKNKKWRCTQLAAVGMTWFQEHF